MSRHVNQGSCPGEGRPESRDPDCPACVELVRAEAPRPAPGIYDMQMLHEMMEQPELARRLAAEKARADEAEGLVRSLRSELVAEQREGAIRARHLSEMDGRLTAAEADTARLIKAIRTWVETSQAHAVALLRDDADELKASIAANNAAHAALCAFVGVEPDFLSEALKTQGDERFHLEQDLVERTAALRAAVQRAEAAETRLASCQSGSEKLGVLVESLRAQVKEAEGDRDVARGIGRTDAKLNQAVREILGSASGRSLLDRARDVVADCEHYRRGVANWLAKHRGVGRPCGGCRGCGDDSLINGNFCVGARWIAPAEVLAEVGATQADTHPAEVLARLEMARRWLAETEHVGLEARGNRCGHELGRILDGTTPVPQDLREKYGLPAPAQGADPEDFDALAREVLADPVAGAAARRRDAERAAGEAGSPTEPGPEKERAPGARGDDR